MYTFVIECEMNCTVPEGNAQFKMCVTNAYRIRYERGILRGISSKKKIKFLRKSKMLKCLESSENSTWRVRFENAISNQRRCEHVFILLSYWINNYKPVVASSNPQNDFCLIFRPTMDYIMNYAFHVMQNGIFLLFEVCLIVHWNKPNLLCFQRKVIEIDLFDYSLIIV